MQLSHENKKKEHVNCLVSSMLAFCIAQKMKMFDRLYFFHEFRCQL